MKLSETKKLLSMLRAQYQHKFVIDDVTEVVWHGLLNEPPEVPAEAVYQAAMTWMKDNEWPPQVRDLRDIIATTICGIPDAEEAWRIIEDRLKRTYPGMTNSLPPLDPLIAESLRAVGGTHNARNEPEATRKRFMAEYGKRRREQVAVMDVPASLTAIDRGTRKAIA